MFEVDLLSYIRIILFYNFLPSLRKPYYGLFSKYLKIASKFLPKWISLIDLKDFSVVSMEKIFFRRTSNDRIEQNLGTIQAEVKHSIQVIIILAMRVPQHKVFGCRDGIFRFANDDRSFSWYSWLQNLSALIIFNAMRKEYIIVPSKAQMNLQVKPRLRKS